MLEHLGAARLPDDIVASFVGDGARVLVARALQAAGFDAGRVDAALPVFLERYDRRLTETTRVYDEIGRAHV